MMMSGLVWRMALGHLKKQWKQTLVTILAGAIGAMLIAVSAVNYESVKRSGAEWIESHLGPISWRLTPEKADSSGFSAQETAFLMDYTRKAFNGFRLLPYVKAEAAVVAKNADTGEETALNNILFIGFSMEEAARFDLAGAELWKDGLADDELIINRETAGLLRVETGDTLSVSASNGDKLFRVRAVTEQRGLTGYLESGVFAGTIIGTERTVRELSGQAGDGYEAILAGALDPSTDLYGMFLIPDHPYQVEYLKHDFKNKIDNLNYSFIIGMISIAAIVSSMLFMRQVLVMIGESRREIYGILRAIGLSQGNIAAMFIVEAVLLSLFSALLGTLLGISGGYGLIHLFYGVYAEELARMAGSPIAIHPYVSIATAAVVFAAILLFLSAISLFAARKVSRFNIVEALRGPSDGEEAEKRNHRRRLVTRMLWIAGLSATCIHLIFAFVQPPVLNGENLLLIAATWLIACCTALSAALAILGKIDIHLQKFFRVIGAPPISMMLAVKYPRRHKGRTYTAALMFALVMMVITFTVCLIQLILVTGNVDRTNQTVFGFGGYASYRTVGEKLKIEAAAAKDPFIREHVKGTMSAEPFMLNMIENGIAQAAVPVTKELLQSGGMKLLARAPAFSSDEAAWQAVLKDPKYIILPHFYMMDDPLSPAEDITLVKAGDTIALPVYENKLRTNQEAWEPAAQRTFTVAGFVPNDAAVLLVDFYGATFMHKSVVEELRPFGYKWSNQNDLGFVLFQFDHKDIKLAQKLEERFTIQGVLTFNVPYLKNSAEQLMNKQIGYGFVGFTVISACIGLMGLAIIQFRAVRERSRQIGMMRCVGLPGKHIYWMFLIEGFVISAIGLLVGLAIGSSGARILVENIRKDIRVFEEPIIFHYPFDILLPIIGGLLLASLLINIAPARAALMLRPADALRMRNE